MLKRILFIGFLFLIIGCEENKIEETNMFITPENTLETFNNALNNNRLDIASQCFILPMYFGKPVSNNGMKVSLRIKNKNIITTKDVVEMEQSMKENDANYHENHEYKEYQAYLRDRDTYKKIGDVEISITETDKNGSYDSIVYLRNINGQWKMIDLPR
jgi:hypothetical protein